MPAEIIAFIPITVLIIGALITKRIGEMMFISSFLAAILLYKENFFSGFIEMIYGTLSNPSYQFVLIILICFGGMIKLLMESGALAGFSKMISGFANGQKKPMIFAWFLSLLMFADDFLETLGVSFSMREVTDRNRIPREHLAFQTNIMATAACTVIPFSSWTAFTVGLLSVHGLALTDYLRSIPYMIYPFLMMILCLFVTLKIIPKVGILKKSYQRVDQGGETLYAEKSETPLVNFTPPEQKKESSALNAIIPIATLVIVSLIFDKDLVHGLLAAIAVQCVLYVAQKNMSLSQAINIFFDGARSMTAFAIILCFAFTLSAANKELGFFDILIHSISTTVPPQTLPVMVYLVVAFTSFATSGYWIIQTLTIPIFIPLAFMLNIEPAIIIAALMSGVNTGCNTCFYCGPVFTTASGTGVANMRLVKTILPYALAAAAITSVSYLILGFIMI